MITRSGLATSRGFAAGPAFLFCGSRDFQLPEYSLAANQVEAEVVRVRAALAETRHELEQLVKRLSTVKADAADISKGETDIFTNHLAILSDEVVTSAIEKVISRDLVNAECAVRKAVNEFRCVFAKMDDAYLRERVRDIDDVEKRILRRLLGHTESIFPEVSCPIIVIADDLSPSETIAMPRDKILGIATDRGSSTSHVALLARALGIPAVTGLGDITSLVEPGDSILLDGTTGTITIHPDAATQDEFAALSTREQQLAAKLAADNFGRGAFKDGVAIAFLANVQPGMPLADLARAGAEGIGLYRSEYLWMDGRDESPTEDEQFAEYVHAVKAMGALPKGARVTFRCLDIGGDKMPRGKKNIEANPFLGNRSIRYLLSRRDVFRTQLRAILRASAFGPCAIMYPMVATVEELRDANDELSRTMDDLAAEGIPFDEKILRGAMIEVPSAALAAEQLAREVSFFSIGTNDLVQYTMAADRGNEKVSYLYQPTHPAVIRLVKMALDAAVNVGIPVSVCGETASDPTLGLLWAGMGASALSMGVSSIPVLKRVVRAFTQDEAKALAAEVLERIKKDRASSIYSFCRGKLEARLPDIAELQSFSVP